MDDASRDLEPTCMTEVLTLARSAPTDPRDPESKRTLRELYESDIACISGHLAAMQTFVFPVVKRALPDGRDRVAGLTLLVHEHERLLRVIHGHLRGDVHASAGAMSQLQRELGDLVGELQTAESDLEEALEAVLSPEQILGLTRQLEQAGAHAPTRPHPHAPHRAGLRRLSFRLSAILDHTLDAMESRSVSAA